MKRKRIFWRGGAAAAVLIILFCLPDSSAVRIKNICRNLLIPVQNAVLNTGGKLKAGTDSIRGFSDLADENRRLKKELTLFEVNRRVDEHLKDENRRLRELLNFRDQQTIELIPAQVVTRSISGWWQSVSLNKGTKDGVFENQTVLSPDGLIGRVSMVSGKNSEVILLSDPACKVSARIDRTGSFGLVNGGGVNAKGDPVATMRFIHKETPVGIGDKVVTSGLGGVYPANLLIGRVENISMEEGGLYQVAEIILQAASRLGDAVFVIARAEEGSE
jgi:rod shape-determining protein MreC